MVLVVDAGKGIQTQTAECIVIGEVRRLGRQEPAREPLVAVSPQQLAM